LTRPHPRLVDLYLDLDAKLLIRFRDGFHNTALYASNDHLFELKFKNSDD